MVENQRQHATLSPWANGFTEHVLGGAVHSTEQKRSPTRAGGPSAAIAVATGSPAVYASLVGPDGSVGVVYHGTAVKNATEARLLGLLRARPCSCALPRARARSATLACARTTLFCTREAAGGDEAPSRYLELYLLTLMTPFIRRRRSATCTAWHRLTTSAARSCCLTCTPRASWTRTATARTSRPLRCPVCRRRSRSCSSTPARAACWRRAAAPTRRRSSGAPQRTGRSSSPRRRMHCAHSATAPPAERRPSRLDASTWRRTMTGRRRSSGA